MKTLVPRTVLKIPPILAALCACAVHSASAATEQWQGQPSVSASLNWSDAANWTDPKQSYYNQVQFTGVGANANTDFSVNCILDSTTGVAQMPIWELDYIPVNGNYTTLIDPGVTLTTGAGYGSMFVGADVSNDANSPAPADAVETITFTGEGGALSVVNTIYVGQGSSQADSHNVTLDLSGLGNFQMPGVSGSRLLVGFTRNNVPRSQGTVYLAKTNNISLGADFQIGYDPSSSNSLPSAVYLGLTNAIYTGSGNNYLVVGNSGCTNALLAFNPAFANAAQPPTAYFGSTSGSRGNWWIANDVGGLVPGHAICDFTGGNVTIMGDTMQLGMAGDGAASSATGVLTFDNGTIDVNTIVSGNQTVSSGGAGIGIINVNSNAAYNASATLIVGSSLTLASVNGAATPGSAGTLNINGGTVLANVITNGGGVATIALNNGTLTAQNIVGTPAMPIDNFSAADSSLKLAVIPDTTNIVAASLTTGGATNAISITSVPPLESFPARITLIKYSGSIGGAGYNFGLQSLPPLCSGYLENDLADSSVVLVLTTAPRTLTWTGAINGNWDTTDANWLAGGSSVYRESDFVEFFDGAASPTVQLTAAVSPGGIIVSNTAAYAFTGSGFISGSTSLIKQGAGALVIDNSGINDFAGGVSISDGTLQIGANDSNGNLPPAAAVANNGALIFDRNDGITVGNAISGTGTIIHEGGNTMVINGANTFSGTMLVTNASTLQLGSDWTALGSASGPTIIASGSTLDMNGRYLGSEPLIVSGSGVDGNGVLVDNGGAVYGVTSDLTLAGDATFGYNNRWDLSSATLSTGGHPYNLTLAASAGVYFQWDRVKSDASLADINLLGGNFGIIGSTTLGDPAGTLSLASGSYLVFYSGDTDVNLNKRIVNDSATIQNVSGAATLNGQMVFTAGSYCTFDVGGTSLTLNSILSGDGVLYKQSGTSTLILNGNSPDFTGGILSYAGKLVLNGSIAGGVSSQSGTTLAGAGTAGGLVDVGGALLPGDASAVGTLTAGGLTLESGAELTMDLNSTTTTGNGVNDLVQINGDLTVNGNTLYINPVGASLADGTYTLMTYTGSANGFFSGAATATPSRYTFTLVNDTTTTPKQVRLVVAGSGGGPASLAWNNASGDSQWNTASSLNWSNRVTQVSPDSFYAQDSVLFDDSAATKTIEIGATVSPSLVTVNSGGNYTFEGAGKISGVTGLVKQGTGTLMVNTVNDFTGNISIQAGTVIMGNGSALGATNGAVTITNTGVLDVNGSYFWSKPIVVSGIGSGNGAIINSGGGVYGLASMITLAGDTTFGGDNRWDLTSGSTLSTGGKPYNLALMGSYRELAGVNIDTNLADIDIQCTVGLKDLASLGNPTNTLTIESGHEVDFWSGNGPAKIFHLMPGATVKYLAGDTFDNAFVFEDGAILQMVYGARTFHGPVTLNGIVTLQIGDGTCAFTNVISGPGGISWTIWNNTLSFSAANTYQGMTYLGDGRTLALSGNGSISASSPIVFGGSDGNSTRIDVTGRADQTLTLTSGQILSGIGKISGSLNVQNGATLQPGTNGVMGTLTASGTAALSGTATMKLNGPGTNDLIQAGSALTYGGTLSLVFSPGTLAAGDTFKLFSAPTCTGSFESIVPATPGAGLSWDTSDLVNGNLKVAGAAFAPKIGKITTSAPGVLSLIGTGGAPNGAYSVLSSTNIALPKASWVQIATGTFDGGGDFSFNITNSAAEPQKFYLMQVP